MTQHTSETSHPTHRADVAVETSPYHIDGMPGGLQLAELDRINSNQAFETLKSMPEFQSVDGSGPDLEKINESIDEEIRSYLEVQGITPDEDEQAYELAFSVVSRALRSSKRDWIGHTTSDGNQDGVSLEVFSELLNHYMPVMAGRHAAKTPTPETQTDESAGGATPEIPEVKGEAENASHLDEETFDLVVDEVNELLDEYAQKVAKRSRSMIESAKTGADIEAISSELSELVAGLASEMYFDWIEKGASHEYAAMRIDMCIQEWTNDTLRKVEAHRLAEYNNSRPYMQKVYDKWAEWSQEKGLFTKGKFWKAATFAVPSAAVGFALAPLVGAVGAGVVTGAVAVAGGRSIARHLANGFLKKRDKRYAEVQTEQMQLDLSAIYDENAAKAESRTSEGNENKKIIPRPEERKLDLFEYVNGKSREYRVRNRNRMLAGTAIAATVGLVSATAADWLTNAVGEEDFIPSAPFGHMPGWLSHNDTGTDGPSGSEADNYLIPGQNRDDLWGPYGDRDHDGVLNHLDPDMDGDGVANSHDVAPLNPNVSDTVKPGGIDMSEIPRDARWIEHGEGGFQTLKELGVPQEKWEAVWADAGEHFAENGKTYLMEDGRYGWSEPGRMTNADITELVKAARRQGVMLEFAQAA